MTDAKVLKDLELSLWDPDTRFDATFMEVVLAPSVVEFGRSGTVYDRSAILATPPRPFEARLDDLSVRMVGDGVALVTYRSEAFFGGNVEKANRSSIWRKHGGGWRLEFHQGTPLP